jgi:uncharacterized protein YaaQ
MKLIQAIVQTDDAADLLDELAKHGYRATRINTAGGFLKASNATILVGVTNDEVDGVLAAIRGTCRTRSQLMDPLMLGMETGGVYLPEPIEVEVGGATVFILDVEQFVRL